MNGEEIQSPSNFICATGKHANQVENGVEREPDSWRNFDFRGSLFTPIGMGDNQLNGEDQSANNFTMWMKSVMGDGQQTNTQLEDPNPEKKDEKFPTLSEAVEQSRIPTPRLNFSLIDDPHQKPILKDQKPSEDAKTLHQKEVTEEISKFLKVQRRQKASIELILGHVKSNLAHLKLLSEQPVTFSTLFSFS